MDDFARSVRLKHYFQDSTNVHVHHHHKLYVKSDWIPPCAPSWIEIPLLAIRHNLCSLHQPSNFTHSDFYTPSKLRPKPKPNLSHSEFIPYLSFGPVKTLKSSLLTRILDQLLTH